MTMRPAPRPVKRPVAKPAKTKAARRGDSDPVGHLPVGQRRGTLRAWDYDSWAATALFVGDANGLADVSAAIEKAKGVSRVSVDVTRDALAGRLERPDGPYVLVIKLRGQEWAPVTVGGSTDPTDPKLAEQLSREAKAQTIWCGHQDTAGATAFRLYDGGTLRIEFASAGEDVGTRFTSDLHRKNWWRAHADENETLQALLRERNAYVPCVTTTHDSKSRLHLHALPGDTLEPRNVERIMLVVREGSAAQRAADTSEALLRAINKGDAAAARKAIDAGASLSTALPYVNEMPLTHATGRAADGSPKHFAVVRALLEAGADPNEGGARSTPVARLIERMWRPERSVRVLAALLDAGADVDDVIRSDPYGDTLLLRAARNGHLHAIELLVARGANVKARNRENRTALELARRTYDAKRKQHGKGWKFAASYQQVIAYLSGRQ